MSENNKPSSSNDPLLQQSLPGKRSWLERSLGTIEKVGNKLPDPAVLFFLLMVFVWALSAVLAPIQFDAVHPSTGEVIQVVNQLSGDQMANFLVNMVQVFVNFAPLGIVLVALLGVGVAEHTGFINAGLRRLLGWTSVSLLTPMLILVAIISHTAADAGYVVVIPLGAVIFYAAGRHPLAGIAAAFAGVSGGFSANFIPSAIDPMLAGITEVAGQVLDPELYVNPLANWFFMSASSIVVIAVGWWLTDKVVEPRLVKDTPVDGDMTDMPTMEPLSDSESRGLFWAVMGILISVALLTVAVLMPESPLRDPNPDLAFHESITSFGAPLMRSIVPLIFILFLIPGIIYGYVAGTIENHKDIIKGMTKSMESMGYYIVMAFFAAQFIAAFTASNLGILLAVNGAEFLQALNLPAQMTIVGIIGLTMFVNLFVGSASAKWLIIAPIFVPMLMQLGISPELTQAAYRVGDSTSNILTPLLPYFPLVVVFCKKYFKDAGIGTLISMMLPYSIALAFLWTAFLLIYWTLGIPLGLQASYVYP
ncbi:MAG: AbgT family transporter [Wenzhouxiangella sp.]|jgi:aminobenzoyl-glutamate transport protein|nr:AbgT family transporter [Wenzhouxiangella sp.]